MLNNHKGKNRNGFTLIELLIVVAIIAILSSAVLIGLRPAQIAGRDARRLSDLRQVQTGLELYFNKCGYYPGKDEAGPTCGAYINPPPTWQDLQFALVGSGIGVNKVPNDPVSTKNYLYDVTGAGGTSYVLGAALEDPNNSAFRDSITGTQAGINCGPLANPPVFCISL